MHVQATVFSELYSISSNELSKILVSFVRENMAMQVLAGLRRSRAEKGVYYDDDSLQQVRVERCDGLCA
jgi:hypothetical protein